MEIASVDERNLDRRMPERERSLKPAEAAADDDDAMRAPVYCW
jgi:hypothetical protein